MITGPRQSGKTTELVNLAREKDDNFCIICTSKFHTKAIRESFDLQESQVIESRSYFEDFINNTLDKSKRYYLDNVDNVLVSQFGITDYTVLTNDKSIPPLENSTLETPEESTVEELSAKSQKIFDTLVNILVDFSFVVKEDCQLSSHFETNLGLDSLDLVELSICVEEEFDILIHDDVLDDIKTISDMVTYIEKVIEL